MSSGPERPLNFEPPPAIRSIVERAEALIDGEVIPLEQRFLSEPFADLEDALEEVRARVREACGVELEWEIRRIGEPKGSQGPGGAV